MATETEIERLVVRLVGDATSYQKMLKEGQQGARRAADEIERVGTRMEGVRRRLESVASGFRRTGQALSRVGRRMSMMITAPLAAIGGLATRESVKFETSLSRIIGLVGLSSDTVVGFRKEILALAPAVGKGPGELADAMFFITSAGFRGAEALETLEISAKAASAGLGETKSVADAVTSAVNSYGKANLSATRATEVLTAAVRAGKADAATFGPVLGQILPTANELGITFDQVGGVLAYLTKSTGSASLAATGLRGVMTQLIRPTEAIRKKMPELTTEYIKQQIATRGLLPTLLLLKDKMKEAGVPITKMFSDIEGLNAMLQLTGPNMADAAQVIKDVGDSAGIVDEAFGAAAATKGFMFAQALAQTKVMLIELGDIVSPVMMKLTQWGIGLMDVWRNIGPEMKKIAVYAGAALAVVGPLLVGAGFVFSGLAATVTVVIALLSPLALKLGIIAAGIAAITYTIVDMTVGWDKAIAAVRRFVTRSYGFLSNFKENIATLTKWFKDNWFLALYDVTRAVQVFLRNFVDNFQLTFEVAGELAAVFAARMAAQLQRALGQITPEALRMIEMGLDAAAAGIKTKLDGLKKPFEGFKWITRAPELKFDLPEALKEDAKEAGKEVGKALGEGFNEEAKKGIQQFNAVTSGIALAGKTSAEAVSRMLESAGAHGGVGRKGLPQEALFALHDPGIKRHAQAERIARQSAPGLGRVGDTDRQLIGRLDRLIEIAEVDIDKETVELKPAGLH